MFDIKYNFLCKIISILLIIINMFDVHFTNILHDMSILVKIKDIFIHIFYFMSILLFNMYI